LTLLPQGHTLPSQALLFIVLRNKPVFFISIAFITVTNKLQHLLASAAMFTKNTTSRVRKKEATAVNNYAVAIKQLRILKYLVSNSAYCKKILSN
jgi:hypothetical protein